MVQFEPRSETKNGNDYPAPPPNVHLASWYPQPSVIPQVDAVIHHGGNNSFTECLYFGRPALILPLPGAAIAASLQSNTKLNGQR